MSEIKGVSFIGGGNMANAIIDAIITSGILSADKICVYEPAQEKQKSFAEKGVTLAHSNSELVQREDDVLFVAVKPQVFDSVLSSISEKFKNKALVSIAAGISVSHIKQLLSCDVPIIRALPNTPMLTLQGMTVLAEAEDVPKDVFEFVKNIFSSAGEVVVLPESKINEAIPLSSSSPAFFFRMIEAMARAGEKYGISYEDAFRLSAVAMQGSASYALTSDKAPQELVSQVSSPGGTTVAALSAFDDFNFEEFIFEATKRCVDRAYELGNKNQ